ncbi:hypothetical protein XELAEV_18045264mg [Xenopus laevis]|uniref:Uncharacterized protein n=1 Tax=Xenopus laevis TaxID=8355 RepID=A0A974C0D0_XENLA|nr:hypothetical protein XELAEV_18045264mg [Xenopus laevis]
MPSFTCSFVLPCLHSTPACRIMNWPLTLQFLAFSEERFPSFLRPLRTEVPNAVTIPIVMARHWPPESLAHLGLIWITECAGATSNVH